MTIAWKLLDLIFKLIRPFIVKNIDPNEDFYCGYCGKPVLRRLLYCSKKCSDSEDYNGSYN